MLIKELDKSRDITSTGFVIQRKKGRGNSKPAGTVYQPPFSNRGYRRLWLDGKAKYLHRAVWEAFRGTIPEGMEIDHINGEKPDNRLENLRLACHKTNLRASRRPGGGSSKYRGVSWHKQAKKWQASIKQNGKFTHLGYFKNEVSAAFARDIKAMELGWPIEGSNFFA